MSEFNLMAVLTGKLQRMHHVQRYSSIPVVFPENVAAHTGQMGMLAYLIGTDYNEQITHPEAQKLDMGKLLSRAVVHDCMSEVMSGDIIRSYKHSSHEIKEACRRADLINVNLLGEEIGGPPGREAILDWVAAKSELEGRVVALCDLLCVVAYCVQEHRAGNTLIDGVMRGMHTAIQEFRVGTLARYVDAVFPTNEWDDPYCYRRD